MIKSADSPYLAGKRGWFWIKFKREYRKELADTFDLVIVGAMHGKGYRAGSYGSLLLAAFDPATNTYPSLTKVGAGFFDAIPKRLPTILKPYIIRHKHHLVDTHVAADVWFEPVKVVEVGADLTVSPVHTVGHRSVKRGGLALRFPRFIRFRDDKTAQQATTSGRFTTCTRLGWRNPERPKLRCGEWKVGWFRGNVAEAEASNPSLKRCRSFWRSVKPSPHSRPVHARSCIT